MEQACETAPISLKALAFECNCGDLRKYEPIVLGVTIPIICTYVALMVLGVSNLVRFKKSNSDSKILKKIYAYSLLSCISWCLYFAFCMENNLWQYVPYATAIYSKLLVGIAY